VDRNGRGTGSSSQPPASSPLSRPRLRSHLPVSELADGDATNDGPDYALCPLRLIETDRARGLTAPHSEYREKLLGGTEATSSRGAALTVYRRLFLQRDHFRTRASHPDRPRYIWLTSSVQTLKLTSVLGPKVWVIGTSAASRP
jgi:hypothetical protein